MRLMRLTPGMVLGLLWIATAASGQTDADRLPVPPGLEPFEQIVGVWNGRGIPAKNRLKGWTERHSWAWKFADGKPVALTIETAKGKLLTKAVLTNDPKTGLYTLQGTDSEGKAVTFTGKIDEAVGMLSLDRNEPPAEIGEERLDLAMNSNKIRYSMRLFRKEPGAPQYALFIDANMGKEGEAFAAGGAAADLPKCIVTGGAGTMTVSFQGKSFPICCSGCRDEFNDNPEKYVQKFLARNKGSAPATTKTVSSTEPSKPSNSTPPAESPGEMTKKEDDPKEAPAKPSDANRKANSLLLQAQGLEKLGKTQAAVIYFKRIVKEFPDSPAAATAKARIKALGG